MNLRRSRGLSASQFALQVALIASAWLCLVRAAEAQPSPCPIDPYLYPEKCAKIARRRERQAEKAARIAAEEAYRVAHPLRISAIAQADLFMLGLGNAYVAGFWGLSAGASLAYELEPRAALRVDLSARFGRGHISNWNIDDPGPIDTSAGYLAGAELRAAYLRRMRAFYVGPALSLGLLHLRGRTLREEDFRERDESSGHTVHVPHDAAWLAGGVMFGAELTPSGGIGLNCQIMPGIWNDFRHLYGDVSLVLTVKLWD